MCSLDYKYDPKFDVRPSWLLFLRRAESVSNASGDPPAASAFPPARHASTERDTRARARRGLPLACPPRPPRPAKRSRLARARRGPEKTMRAANERTRRHEWTRARVSSRSTLGGRTTARASCSPLCSWLLSPSPRSSRWRTSPSSTPTRATRCDACSPDARKSDVEDGIICRPVFDRSLSDTPHFFHRRLVFVFVFVFAASLTLVISSPTDGHERAHFRSGSSWTTPSPRPRTRRRPR